MSLRAGKVHPFNEGDVVRVNTITDIAECRSPQGSPTWRVISTFWEDGEPGCSLRRYEPVGGITRRVEARRCFLVSAVDQLGDVARE